MSNVFTEFSDYFIEKIIRQDIAIYVTITHCRHHKAPLFILLMFSRRAPRKKLRKRSRRCIRPGISRRFSRDTWLIIYGKSARGCVPCRSRSIAWVEVSVRRDEIAITRLQTAARYLRCGREPIIMHKSRWFYHSAIYIKCAFFKHKLLFAFNNASKWLTVLQRNCDSRWDMF